MYFRKQLTLVFSSQTIDWSLSSGRWALLGALMPIFPKNRLNIPVDAADALSSDFFFPAALDGPLLFSFAFCGCAAMKTK